MKKVYVIQNENDYVIGVTLELQKAMQLCKEDKKLTYRIVDLYLCDGTTISLVAGSIPQDYFPSETVI